MTIKRAPPRITLSLDDHKKFTTFVALFLTIHQKTKTKKSKGKKNDKPKFKYPDIGPWLSRPLIFLNSIKQALLRQVFVAQALVFFHN